MPKVELSFDVRGWIQQQVEVPQSVIDAYKREIEKENPDCDAIDKMLEPFINYEGILEQIDEPNDIELEE